MKIFKSVFLVLLGVLLLMPAMSIADDGERVGYTNLVQSYNYTNGVLTSIYDATRDYNMIFRAGKIVGIEFADIPGLKVTEFIYEDGQLIKSINNATGDETYYMDGDQSKPLCVLSAEWLANHSADEVADLLQQLTSGNMNFEEGVEGVVVMYEYDDNKQMRNMYIYDYFDTYATDDDGNFLDDDGNIVYMKDGDNLIDANGNIVATKDEDGNYVDNEGNIMYTKQDDGTYRDAADNVVSFSPAVTQTTWQVKNRVEYSQGKQVAEYLYDAEGTQVLTKTYNYDGNLLVSCDNWVDDDRAGAAEGDRKIGSRTYYDKGRPSETYVVQDDGSLGAMTEKYVYTGTMLYAVESYEDGECVKRVYMDNHGRQQAMYDVEDGCDVRLAQEWTYNDTLEPIVINYEIQVAENMIDDDYVLEEGEYWVDEDGNVLSERSEGAILVRPREATVMPGGMIASFEYFDSSGEGSVWAEITYYNMNKMQDTIQATVTVPDSPIQCDPWTCGLLTVIDGMPALIVNPADVDGMSFYNFDPTSVSGGTKTDEDGNLIFMLNAEDEETLQALLDLANRSDADRTNGGDGITVNLMWQYYSPPEDQGTNGYTWLHLAPTDDHAVAYHLNNDNAAMVEQWGGEWDRTKQYVVIT
ncbi:MAG: hypothetical protein JXJ19_09905 [Elusimicrobia bacterium]|nr:hypothetical protein [Elusimicrobiota bacterium]